MSFTTEEIDYIRKLFSDPSTRYNVTRHLQKHNPDFYERMVNETSFLDKDATITERAYCVVSNLMAIPLCSWCHQHPTSYKRSLGELGGYSPYCCISCGTKAQLAKRGPNKPNVEKSKATRLAKYGGYTSKDFKDKLKQTKLQRYGDANYVNKEKAQQTIQERYGSEEELYKRIISQGQQTKLDRYGSASYNNPSKISETKQAFSQDKTCLINAKRELTNLLKYGGIAPLKNEEVLKKSKTTCLQRYGVDTILRLPDAHNKSNMVKREQAYQTMLAQTGEYEPLFTKEEFMQGKCKDGTYFKWRHKCCGSVVEGRYADGRIFAHCRICYPYGSSIEEKELLQYMKGIYAGEIRENDRRVIAPKELDIYIPERKLAIEFDGLFWHSAEYGCDPRHLLEKTNSCNACGIRLIHVFEDEWLSAKEIVKSRLSNLLGLSKRISARKCSVVEVSAGDANAFLSLNHIQGPCPSKIRLGLTFNDELIALMTFGKPRFNKTAEWELLRFCNKLGCAVVGGAGRLLKHFEMEHAPSSLLSYADRRWSNGEVYEALGFNKVGESAPNYWYSDGTCSQRYSRLQFQKHKLSALLKTFDPSKTEAENMIANGYRRIYDCGNLVYLKTYDSVVNTH